MRTANYSEDDNNYTVYDEQGKPQPYPKKDWAVNSNGYLYNIKSGQYIPSFRLGNRVDASRTIPRGWQRVTSDGMNKWVFYNEQGRPTDWKLDPGYDSYKVGSDGTLQRLSPEEQRAKSEGYITAEQKRRANEKATVASDRAAKSNAALEAAKTSNASVQSAYSKAASDASSAAQTSKNSSDALGKATPGSPEYYRLQYENTQNKTAAKLAQDKANGMISGVNAGNENVASAQKTADSDAAKLKTANENAARQGTIKEGANATNSTQGYIIHTRPDGSKYATTTDVRYGKNTHSNHDIDDSKDDKGNYSKQDAYHIDGEGHLVSNDGKNQVLTDDLDHYYEQNKGKQFFNDTGKKIADTAKGAVEGAQKYYQDNKQQIAQGAAQGLRDFAEKTKEQAKQNQAMMYGQAKSLAAQNSAARIGTYAQQEQQQANLTPEQQAERKATASGLAAKTVADADVSKSGASLTGNQEANKAATGAETQTENEYNRRDTSRRQAAEYGTQADERNMAAITAKEQGEVDANAIADVNQANKEKKELATAQAARDAEDRQRQINLDQSQIDKNNAEKEKATSDVSKNQNGSGDPLVDNLVGAVESLDPETFVLAYKKANDSDIPTLLKALDILGKKYGSTNKDRLKKEFDFVYNSSGDHTKDSLKTIYATYGLKYPTPSDVRVKNVIKPAYYETITHLSNGRT